ncbi:MAG: hypothetical protein BWY08_00956 [Bacteroidetes bacterium ADurb.Bin174]|jgi:uncharacterized protein YqgC (DUF456 family)|nr:MAG: hypothetical protein BWY08_00956 [Bacteroidetes bacterium ADurb.Bin174]
METLLIILAFILIILGILGSILPILPGVPISYVGILLLHFTEKVQFTTQFLIFWLVMVILVQVLDYLVPIWGTKKFGGSKRGIWGCAIGMVVGLFFGPWGIILGPFFGAIVGELSSGKQTQSAIKAGFGSFIGFLLGVVSKLIVGGFLLYYAIVNVV